MARHASLRTPAVRRALAVLATVGAALGAGAATAAAADTGAVGGLAATAGTVGHVAGPVAGLKPNPLAGTGVDPLDNGVGTQVADLPPLTSTALTRPVAQAESVGAIPVAGRAAELLGTATRG